MNLRCFFGHTWSYTEEEEEEFCFVCKKIRSYGDDDN
jgi:hypothetical protein